jgi:hypothetical protein
MKRWHPIFIAAILVTISGSLVFAQGGPGRGMPNYDPKTETTVQGTVEDVQQQAGRHGWMGTHLVLKTGVETLEVHVGPSNYIQQKDFSFAKGDSLSIVGSRVTIDGKPALIAREITKEGKTLALRNASGVPLWSRGRPTN